MGYSGAGKSTLSRYLGNFTKYPCRLKRFTCLKRVVSRYKTYKGKAHPDIAKGCNEKIDLEFLSWVLFGGRTRVKIKEYKEIAKRFDYKTVVIKNQRELDRLYENSGKEQR